MPLRQCLSLPAHLHLKQRLCAVRNLPGTKLPERLPLIIDKDLSSSWQVGWRIRRWEKRTHCRVPCRKTFILVGTSVANWLAYIHLPSHSHRIDPCHHSQGVHWRSQGSRPRRCRIQNFTQRSEGYARRAEDASNAIRWKVFCARRTAAAAATYTRKESRPTSYRKIRSYSAFANKFLPRICQLCHTFWERGKEEKARPIPLWLNLP